MNTPTFTDVRLVGAYHRGPEVQAMAEALLPGDEVTLEREPENQYDPQAIKVMLREVHLGYIARQTAAFMAGYLDDGHSFTAKVTGKQGQYPLLQVGPAQ